MMQWFAINDGLIFGPAFVLIQFMVVFLGVLVWVCRPGSSEEYERAAALPLDAGSGGEGDPPRSRQSHGEEGHGQANR